MADFLSLQDQIPAIRQTVDGYIACMQDAREFYKERREIEREASQRLAALSKKAQERYAARAATLCVGESPAKAWNGQHNSFGNAWATVISETSSEANDRAALADALQHEVIDPLKTVIARKTELSKKHFAFYQQLVAERDKTLAAKDSAKARYDSACGTVESNRAKQEHSTSDSKAEKAGRHFDKATTEMGLAKNEYLRSIAVANAAKEHFFGEDMAALTKAWQSIWTLLVRRFVMLLLRANDVVAYQRAAALKLSEREKGIVSIVDPASDQSAYASANQRTFFKPGDAVFEPCAVWHDPGAPEISNDQCRVFLQNSVAVGKRKLSEPSNIESMRKEVANAENVITRYIGEPRLGDPDEVQENALDTQRQLMLAELDRSNTQADVNFMLQALGNDLGGREPHQLKPSAFPVPVACAVCGSNIWGIGKPGSTCRSCGQSVHKACELKLPASCGSEPPVAALKRTESRKSTSSEASSAAGRREPPARPPPRGSIKRTTPAAVARPTSSALYPYTAADETELSIAPGDALVVLQAEAGEGWSRVEDASGRQGLVPASYISSGSSVSQIAAPSANGAASLTVIHDFGGQGGDELSASAGDKVSLAGQGHSYGGGWIEVQTSSGQRGILPEWAVQ